MAKSWSGCQAVNRTIQMGVELLNQPALRGNLVLLITGWRESDTGDVTFWVTTALLRRERRPAVAFREVHRPFRPLPAPNPAGLSYRRPSWGNGG